MLHPRLTALDGSRSAWLAQIGPYGAWSDLTVTTRWGQGASGMFEAEWSMPLPPGFSHPLLRRGTIVELMDGPWRVGSPLILGIPGQGSGIENPWTLTATGVGSEVEGDNSWYAVDGSDNPTSVMRTAIDRAIADGLPWTGRDASVFAGPFATDPPENVYTLGGLLSAVGDYLGQRWLVDNAGFVGFRSDPTTPSYHVVPGVAELGTADDDYASVVFVRYINSTSHAPAVVRSPSSASAVEQRFGRREFWVDAPPDKFGEIDAFTAQAMADGILAKSKGRLAWTNGLTVTSNEILTSGGVPANLSKVLEDVGTGCMVRLHGIFDDLLEVTGNTWLDIVIGQAKWVDGAASIDLSPLGLAPRDLASVVESVTGMAA